jgi:hypothetical protein
MDIVWTGLGICILVGFVFYVLALYWQRLLTKHSYAIRDLAMRVQALEEMEDPNFRKKIGDSAPSPLEQVITFGFRLGERFWEGALQAQAEEVAYVKAYGKFLGSVKIERWRSHSVVTVYEVLPQSKSAEWESRSIDVYSSGGGSAEPVTLWELPLAASAEYAPEPAPGLELRLVDNALELRAAHGRFDSAKGNGAVARLDEFVFFRIPLDAAQLGEYRKQETEDARGPEETQPSGQLADSWMSYFANHDERCGIDWQLCIRDLTRKEEWERWRVWEPWETR